MLMTSEMSLYFMILSADVVDVSDGEAFTFITFIRIHQVAARKFTAPMFIHQPESGYQRLKR